MAENQETTKTTKTKRDLLGERLKNKYPDREYADDEELFGQINDDYDDYDNQLSQYKEREGKFADMLSKDPKSAQFITDLAKGNDPWIAVIERLGIDGVTELMNDPETKAKYEEANQRYIQRVAKEKELEAEYEANQAESLKMREELDAKYGEETVDAALGVIDQITKDAIMGKVTPETFDMALKAVNHDADVEEARTEGTIAGRNSKIEETLRKPKIGDGLPNLGGSNIKPKGNKRPLNIFDYAEAAK